MLATCSENINIYDMDAFASKEIYPSFTTTQKKTYTSYATFNPNCKILATGGDEGVIHFYHHNLEYIQPIIDNDILDSSITSINFNYNSKCLAYAAKNGFFKIYDIGNSKHLLNCQLPNDYVTSLQFNNDSSKITIATKNGSIYSYSSPTYQVNNFKTQINENITYMKYSPILLDTIGLCTEEGGIKVIDLINGNIINNLTGYHAGCATAIAFSPISKVFYGSCGVDGKINLFDMNERKLKKTLHLNVPLTSLSFNAEGNQLICGSSNGNVYIYDPRESDPRNILLGNKGTVNYIEIGKKNLIQKGQKSSNTSMYGNDLSIKSLNNTSKQPIGMSYNQNETKRTPLNDKNNINKTSQNEKVKETEGIKEAYKSTVNYTNKEDSNQMVVDYPNTQMKKGIEYQSQLQLIQSSQCSNKNNESELDTQTKQLIKGCIENEFSKLRQNLHEELNTLHLGIIRQFAIEKANMMQNLQSISFINSAKAQEIEALKRENESLRSKFF